MIVLRGEGGLSQNLRDLNVALQSSKVDDDKDKGDKAVSHDEDDIDAGMSIICFENLSFATDTSRAAGRCARIRHFALLKTVFFIFKTLTLFPPCNRMGTVSKHLRHHAGAPAPAFVQYSDRIQNYSIQLESESFPFYI